MYIRFVEILGNWLKIATKNVFIETSNERNRLGKYSQRPKEITVVVIARAYSSADGAVLDTHTLKSNPRPSE